MVSDPTATLAIIAGGKALRLAGAEKGMLLFEGRTLLSRLLDLRPLFGDALLVANIPTAYPGYALRRVSDLVLDRGAPGGVHAALAQSRTPWLFAAACDMPFVTAPVVQALLCARDELTDVICFEVGGRLEPLLGAYRCSIADAWGRALASQPSFRDLFGRFRLKLLPEERLRAVDPGMRAITSVNTPEDLVRMNIGRPSPEWSLP